MTDDVDPGPRSVGSTGEIDVADEALIAGIVAGDQGAGSAFVHRHQHRVYGIALAVIGDPDLAQDVAQEAFIRVWRHAAVYEARRGAVSAWIGSITRNLAIDAVRLRRAIPIDPGDLVWQRPITTRSVEQLVIAAEETELVRSALSALPLEQRRALELATYRGASASEIAELEGIALGTAKSRLRLGLDKVRRALDEGNDL